MPSTRGLGPVGAVGIAAAFLAMTTLLPAVLVIFGRWLFWPFVPRYSPDAVELDVAAQHGVWRRIAVPGAQALVGGDTAYLIDEETTVSRDNRTVVPLVLAVAPWS
ncbi:MMPL family transporter [Micromonospora globispora]|uniref:MMPL family transporter n=1 Tax=Micromonospora globispora TaxID=1450148 RepID=UPI003F689AFD